MDKAYFGAGCFWGVEHIFSKIDGVSDVVSGYMGGDLENPSYEDICTGITGHAEVVEVNFDSSKVTYEVLLDYFWRLHDPTQKDRQGVDVGTQYRSAIFYLNESQKESAQKSMNDFNSKEVFDVPAVTEITSVSTFYPAEDYHQDYYLKKYQGADGPICHVLRDR